MGVFCFRRFRWILIAWLVVMAAGGAVIGPVFSGLGSGNNLSGSEVKNAGDALSAGTDKGIEYFVLVHHVNPASPATQAVLDKAEADTRAIAGVKSVSGPAVGRDGTSVALTVTLAKADSQYVPYHASRDRLQQLASQLPGSSVLIGGGDLLSEDANHAIQNDLTFAEELSIPITLIVLLFIFGGIIAASLPVLAALGTVLGGYGILMTYSAFAKLDGNAVTVVSLLGLALSIDYGLLIVARYREELVRTSDREEAVRRTWRTAGRTILFSGLTVAGALASLLAFNIDTLREMGVSAVSTTLMAMLAALTLTPALLGLAGGRVKPSAKQVAREVGARAHEVPEGGFFGGLARATQKLPVVAILGCLAILVLIASPARNTVVRVPQLEALPPSLASVQVSDEMASQFGITSADPAVKVVARMSAADLQAYAQRWSSDPAVTGVERADAVNANLSTVVFDVKGDPQGSAARDLVRRLRADRPAGVQSWVAGDAAMLVDLDSRLEAGLPFAAGIAVAAMLVLLFLMTGSVVIPIKALITNAVSLSASFGVLVLMFQEGHVAGLSHLRVVGGLSPYMIAIVFAFALGLSMDYEVFLLSRIKEYADAGVDADAAVRGGLQRSGRIITSAALLMLIVFACFATAQTAQIQEIGIGLFVAVLIDATLVRCVLVPATMSLLGRAAWWAPGPLRRFQERHGMSESEPAAIPVPDSGGDAEQQTAALT